MATAAAEAEAVGCKRVREHPEENEAAEGAGPRKKRRQAVLPRRGKKETAARADTATLAKDTKLESIYDAVWSTLRHGMAGMGRCGACREESDGTCEREGCVGEAGSSGRGQMIIGDARMLESHGVVRVLVRRTKHLATVGRSVRMCVANGRDVVEKELRRQEEEEGCREGSGKREVKGVICLSPTEALQLVDRRAMLLLRCMTASVMDSSYPEDYLSVAETYCLLLGHVTRGVTVGDSPLQPVAEAGGLSLTHYSAYTFLKKLGYVVLPCMRDDKEMAEKDGKREENVEERQGEEETVSEADTPAVSHRSWWRPLSCAGPYRCEAPTFASRPPAFSFSPSSFPSLSPSYCPANADGWSLLKVYQATKQFSRAKSTPKFVLAVSRHLSSVCLSLATTLRLLAEAEAARVPLVLCVADAGLKLSFLAVDSGINSSLSLRPAARPDTQARKGKRRRTGK